MGRLSHPPLPTGSAPLLCFKHAPSFSALAPSNPDLHFYTPESFCPTVATLHARPTRAYPPSESFASLQPGPSSPPPL